MIRKNIVVQCKLSNRKTLGCVYFTMIVIYSLLKPAGEATRLTYMIVIVKKNLLMLNRLKKLICTELLYFSVFFKWEKIQRRIIVFINKY